MQTSSPGERRLFLYCNALFGLSLLIGAIFIFHLPLFPNGDGPLHLYYSHILWSLATHQPQYQHYYAIRHLIGIYSLHYFALILFGKFLSSAMAEKLFTVITVVNTALGFRFLAARLGGNAPVASLWMIPLLLNWPLGAGFFNFCFATGMMYWALGFWICLQTSESVYTLIGLVVSLVLLLFSHPIPLGVLVVFMAVDLIAVWFQKRKSAEALRLRAYWPQLAALVLGLLAMIVPAMLVQKKNMIYHLPDFYPHKYLIEAMMNGQYIGLFGGNRLLQLVYTEALIFIVPGCIFLLVVQMLKDIRRGGTTEADRLLIFSTLFLIATFFFPPLLNGSAEFPERFWSLLWPLPLACGAAATVRVRTLQLISLAGVAIIFATGILAIRTLPPIAQMQMELSRIRPPKGSKGVFLQDWVPGRYPLGLSYSVFYWSGVRALIPSDAILLNSPWIDQTHLPLKENGRAGLLADYLGWDNIDPPGLFENLIVSSKARDITLRNSDFIIFSDPVNQDRYLKESVHAILRDQQDQWSCKYGSYFALCEKR